MMKRKMIFTALFALLFFSLIIFPLQTVSASSYYRDETNDGTWRWAGRAIHWAKENEVAYGMENGYFRPDLPVTRAQAYTMLMRLYEQYEAVPSSNSKGEIFEDCVNAWYTESVQKAVSAGILEYRPDSLFYPNEPITRREAVKLLFHFSKLKSRWEPRYEDWKGELGILESGFSDVVPGSKNILEIKLARDLYIVQGGGNNCFCPDKYTTRGEFVRMLYRVSCILNRNEFQPENFSDILTQASSVTYIGSELYEPEFNPSVELSASEIANIRNALSDKRWTEFTNMAELPQNLPDYWICALDDEGFPILRIGVDDEFTENSVFLFVGQDELWQHYVVENVKVPMFEKK